MPSLDKINFDNTYSSYENSFGIAELAFPEQSTTGTYLVQWTFSYVSWLEGSKTNPLPAKASENRSKGMTAFACRSENLPDGL